MMTDTAVPGEVSPGGITQIKKELDGYQECSPSNSDMYSPTTTVVNDTGVSTVISLTDQFHICACPSNLDNLVNCDCM